MTLYCLHQIWSQKIGAEMNVDTAGVTAGRAADERESNESWRFVESDDVR